jgi:trimethylamine---corrinoid protein Co-methyltransferase
VTIATPGSIRSLPRTFHVEVLTPEQTSRIHSRALAILDRTGVATTSDRLLELMADHGQRVDFERRRIRFAPNFVEAKRALAPRHFTLAGRRRDRDLALDGAHAYLSPDGSAPQIIDLRTGTRRASTKADLGAMTRLADALPEIGFTWRSVSATDQPGPIHSLHEVEVQFNSTTKHLQTGSGAHADTSRAVVELCRAVAGGAEALRARPNLSSIQCIISPLFWDEGPIEAIATYADAGIPISLTSMPLACATAPCTVAGLVTLTLAELLSGITILQTIAPGAKAICAAYPSTMDLFSGALNLAAAPDDAFAVMACAQVLGALGLPSAGTIFGSGAKRSNWQAGAQGGISTAKSVFAPGDLMSGAGGLYASNVFSPAQLLMDCELFGAVTRWAEGYALDDERIGLDVVDQVGPADHYLGEQHTLDHMRELWRSAYMDRSSWEEWQSAGEPDPQEVAFAEARRILAEHEPEPLDEGLSEELSRIVAAYEADALAHTSDG